MENVKNIPMLRFPEFEGEWETKKLKNVVKINQGLQIAISERLKEQVKNSHFYITNEFLRFGSKKQYYILNPPQSVLCSKDDILMTRTGNTGMVVTNVEGAFHNNFFKVAYPDYIYKMFLYNFLTLPTTQSQILKMAGTSTIPDLNHSDFYSIKLSFPTLPEQQKIASFLTSVDEKRTALKKKKELLEQYKKGVIQKLFSQQIRFKDDDGKEFPKWEKKKLGDISERVTRKNIENNQNVLTISAQQGLINQEKFFNKSVSAKNVTGYYLLEKDEFAYNKSYSNGYPMGAIKRLKYYDKGVVSTLYICFRFKKVVNLSYMEQYFESGKHNHEIEKVAQEGARNHGLLNIALNDFFSTTFPFPCIEEQTKIANFLSAIDKKINQCQQQIEQIIQWKKGLLQKMFV